MAKAHFHYQDGQLFVEQVPVASIAERFGTPCYVYSKAAIEEQYFAFTNALQDLPYTLCYAVKANGNLAVLNLLARQGAGFDIVSRGELERVLAAGGDAKKVIFSGVGKQRQEIERALSVGIACFNVESIAELQRIDQIAAEMGLIANVALRINPEVDVKTHPYIATGLQENKFGIASGDALAAFQTAKRLAHCKLMGIACHIGSQLLELNALQTAIERMLSLVEQLREQDIELQTFDVGGGLGVRYRDEQPPHPSEYANLLQRLMQGKKLCLILEPGRALLANAGILITRVEYLKKTSSKNFIITDAGMNDLIRPALYNAWQAVEPVMKSSGVTQCYDVVGPVCESADFLAKQRDLAVQEGELLAIMGAGAYGFVMSSNYNARPRGAEVLVAGDKAAEVRKRETYAELFASEVIP